MLRRLLHRRPLSYANVMSTIAVMIALGGTSYAAVKLPKGSVGPVQIKADAVTGDKVKDGSLSAADLGSALSSLRGPRGALGPTGQAGQPGQAGPSDAYVDKGPAIKVAPQKNTAVLAARLTDLPAGSYVLMASVSLTGWEHVAFIGTCYIRVSGEDIAYSQTVVGNDAPATLVGVMAPMGSITKPFPFSAELRCQTDADMTTGQPSLLSPTLTAIRVGALHTR